LGDFRDFFEYVEKSEDNEPEKPVTSISKSLIGKSAAGNDNSDDSVDSASMDLDSCSDYSDDLKDDDEEKSTDEEIETFVPKKESRAYHAPVPYGDKFESNMTNEVTNVSLFTYIIYFDFNVFTMLLMYFLLFLV